MNVVVGYAHVSLAYVFQFFYVVVSFQMKTSTYHQLSKVNTTFIKYNLLLGLENLGMADCNKYYVSF